MIQLGAVSARGRVVLPRARGAFERAQARAALTNVSFEHDKGVLGIIGAPRDGTTILFDVVDGTVKPAAGRVAVFGGAPAAARVRVARVSLDAPLPDGLRVDEVCDVAGEVRGEPRRPANERLAVLGIGHLAGRRVRSLALEERRAVALAVALTSKAEVLLVEEPLVAMEGVASSLVVDAIRARAGAACVVVTTASPRDATRLADRLAVLTSGIFDVLPPELAHMSLGVEGSASIRVVVSPPAGKAGAAALVGVLSGADAVTRVETAAYAGGAVAVVATGRDLALLSAAVTQAIATARVDVELVEPSTLSLDAIRSALAARAMSPPPGSLPPGPASVPPSRIPGSIPQAGGPPVSGPPPSLPPGSVPPPSVPPSGGVR